VNDQSAARHVYRLLLRAYPRAYREAYGDEMEDTFLSLLRHEGRRHGLAGTVRCWAGAAWDAGVRGTRARMRPSPGDRRRRTGMGGSDMLGTLLSDLRYTGRSLLRRPMFALTALLTIALAIGANTSVFTIVDGFMLTPLPYEEPDELVIIHSENPALGWTDTDINPADAWDWRERAASVDDLAVFLEAGFNLTGGDAPELVSAVRVTPNMLRLLGRAPALGRDFAPGELGEGRDGVVIITDGYWARRFGGDPEVLGSTLTLDGEQAAVVGVMPPDFLFLDEVPDLLRPLDFDPATTERGGHYAEAVARLGDGATVESARRDLEDVARQLEAEHAANRGWTLSVTGLHAWIAGDVAHQASFMLMGAVGFILLMACVNVANLLLARGGSRAREIAVRVALGAGRGRVVRHMLTESLVLASAGGLLGMIGAAWGYRAIESALPSSIPPIFRFGMDGSVLAFTGAITVGAALLFGLVPALRLSAARAGGLREAGRAGASRGAVRFGSALVVLQTAMAVVLLVGGGLLMKSLSGMRAQDFGFDATNVLATRISLPETQYATKEASDSYWREVTDRVRAVPGVLAAGTTQSHPLMGSNWGGTIRVAGQGDGDQADRRVRITHASAGLFETLGVRMARGRMFTEADAPDAPLVGIVNEAFVRGYLGPRDDPLATSLLLGEGRTMQIVGVVQDIVERGVDSPPEPSLYAPIAQQDIRARSLVVRTSDDPTGFVASIQEAVWAVDADLPLYGTETMAQLVDRRIGGYAVMGYLMGVFALMSLALGAVGIYGVTAYAVGQRTSEIGIRLAVGAKRADVVRMVVGHGARRALVGLVVGLALALPMGAALSGIMIGVSPRDPGTFAAVTATLAVVSLLGLYLPARRAARVDPVRALGAD